MEAMQRSFGAGTDVGLKRLHNEDCFRAEPSLGLWLVADGMGGHRGGEVASRIAADFVVERVRAGENLKAPIQAAHHAILKAVAQGNGPEGMGTTLVALKMGESHYEVAWVGDCRAYLWDEGGLRQLTRDHSYVQYLVDKGIIPKSARDMHTHQNFIMQALGASEHPEVTVDRVRGRISRGQRILLCSDGLNKEMNDAAISEILARRLPDQETVDLLIQTAVQNGGRDNITVVLVSAGLEAPPKSRLAGYAGGLWAFFRCLGERAERWIRRALPWNRRR